MPGNSQKNQWYAWVPVLGEHLVLDPEIITVELHEIIPPEKNEHATETDKRYIKKTFDKPLNEKVESKINELKDATHCSCDSITEVDDKDMAREFLRLIAFRSEENRYVPVWIGILSDDGVIRIAASIDMFEQKTGLYSFALDPVGASGSNFPPSHIAAQVNIRIRDIYHTHTWTSPENDVGMLPVEADCKTSAIERIWEDFFCKKVGVEQKRNVRKALNEAEEVPITKFLPGKFFKAEKRKDRHSIAREWTAKGMGDCLYAKSFIDKFFSAEQDPSARLSFIQRLQECYAMLERKTNADMECRRIPMISVYAVLLAVMMLAIPFSSIGHQFFEQNWEIPFSSCLGWYWIILGYCMAILVSLAPLVVAVFVARKLMLIILDFIILVLEKALRVAQSCCSNIDKMPKWSRGKIRRNNGSTHES